MVQVDLHAKGVVQVLGQVLGGIHRAVPPSGASERNTKAGETSFEISLYGRIYQGIDMLEEGQDFPILLQEADDRLVQSCQGFVGIVSAGIVDGTAVEDEAPAVARRVFGNAFGVGKARDADHQMTDGESGRKPG